VRNRSNLLVLLGIAFFVVGGIIVYVLTSDDDDGSGASGSETVTVVVATKDIPAGSLANDVLADGGVKETRVPAAALQAGAIQSVNQLEGATFIQGFAGDQQIIGAGLQSLQRGYDLPDGYEAIAVKLNFQQGVAGYVNAGDLVNLYGVYGPQYPIEGATLPRAELLLTNVRVLDTNLTIPTNGVSQDASARAGGQDVVYLLAVRTVDAEKVIFDTSFEALYATLVNGDAAPAGPTEGQSGDSILAVEPNVAAA
jgi:Flp pilus assembly protein CpaB